MVEIELFSASQIKFNLIIVYLFHFVSFKVRDVFKDGTFFSSGPDSSAGIATAYGMDGPRIESRWGIFRTCPDRP
jgi:hypothetical protein